jgi:phage baseplate assembly protein W
MRVASYAVKLPLAQDSADGYAMIKRLKRLVKQNLKMLILTNPGERVMEPDYGVGIRQFLFENFGSDVFARIDTTIREQVAQYMPAVQIKKLQFSGSDPDTNTLTLYLEYSIPQIATSDLLEITI